MYRFDLEDVSKACDHMKNEAMSFDELADKMIETGNPDRASDYMIWRDIYRECFKGVTGEDVPVKVLADDD